MSRIIKEYPLVERFGEPLTCTVECINSLLLPKVKIDYKSHKDNHITTTFEPQIRADETEQGIHMQLVELDKDDEPTGVVSDEIILPEIEFCDAIYQSILTKVPVDEGGYIRDHIISLINDFALSEKSLGFWFYDVVYQGEGYIYSDNDIIGTVDILQFDRDDNIILDYCVGNFNLNNIEKCVVKFTTNNKNIVINHVVMLESISNDDYYTYVLQDSRFIEPKEIDMPRNNFTRYDINEEEFLEERYKFLSSVSKVQEEEPDIFEL